MDLVVIILPNTENSGDGYILRFFDQTNLIEGWSKSISVVVFPSTFVHKFMNSFN